MPPRVQANLGRSAAWPALAGHTGPVLSTSGAHLAARLVAKYGRVGTVAGAAGRLLVDDAEHPLRLHHLLALGPPYFPRRVTHRQGGLGQLTGLERSETVTASNT